MVNPDRTFPLLTQQALIKTEASKIVYSTYRVIRTVITLLVVFWHLQRLLFVDLRYQRTPS